MTTTLTGIYHSTVNLDTGSIGATVTVYGSASIQVGFYGGAGIFGGPSVANAYIYNLRTITGGENGGTGPSAAGIYLSREGSIRNMEGGIYGGQGWNNSAGGFAGGDGVDLIGGGAVWSEGKIQGGAGGSSTTGFGGDGGIGIFSAAAANMEITLYVTGGAGGNGKTAGGTGGTGVVLDGNGTLTNGYPGFNDLISGGAGGNGGHASGGTGVFLDAGATLMNTGGVYGGKGGTGDTGGTGVFATAGTITNEQFGVITGGAGAVGIGAAGTAGGIGVELQPGSSLNNAGGIYGGTGGTASYAAGITATGTGGNGGAGLSVSQSTGTLINSGIIAGGGGGEGFLAGGNGGTGVILEGGVSLINTNAIGGGNGGYCYGPKGTAGAGGTGVYLDGGTLTTAGLIAGGKGGALPTNGPNGAAVLFGSVASTLIIDPGATFLGNVIANAAVADVLDLASGPAAGTLTGFGTQFTGFSTTNVESGAQWVFAGPAGTATLQQTINVAGALSISGTLLGAATANVAAGALLQTTGTGQLQVEDLTLAGGTLACSAQGLFAFGTAIGLAQAGAVTVESRAGLFGFGTIASAIAGTGEIEASGGTLLVTGAAASTLALAAATGDTLALSGGGALAGVSGKGTLLLEGTSPFTLAAHNSVKISSLTLGAGARLTGAGTITGALTDAGLLTASGGLLSLSHAASGNGTFAASSGATLDFTAGVKTAGLLTGAGTITFGGASTLGTGAVVSASNVVAAANITLAKGVSLNTAFGQSFAIDPQSGGTITLSGATGDSFTNAGSFTTSGVGTADVGIAFINNANVAAGSGALAFLGSVTNNGVMTAAGGDLTIAGPIGGNGTLVIGPGGTMTLDGATGGSQFVDFLSLNGTLDLAQPNSFGSLIHDFGAGCEIDLLNTASTTFTFHSGVLTVDNGTTAVASLQFIGGYHGSDFAIASDNHGGTMITFT